MCDTCGMTPEQADAYCARQVAKLEGSASSVSSTYQPIVVYQNNLI